MTDLIQKAERWAERLWVRSSKNWLERKQDLKYRVYLTRPAMERVLKSLPPIKNGLFLDIGCGDGSETFHIWKTLKKNGHTGILIGIDRHGSFVGIADSKKKSSNGLKLEFRNISTRSLSHNPKYIGNADVVISTFLIQDLPDTESFFEITAMCLKFGQYAIFLLVHPDYAEAMKKRNFLLKENQLRSNYYWDWAAKYPILETWGKFYVPYFHRSLAAYKKLVGKYFTNVEFIDLIPTKKVVDLFNKKDWLPFSEKNPSYPEIAKIPSSLIIKAKNNTMYSRG